MDQKVGGDLPDRRLAKEKGRSKKEAGGKNEAKNLTEMSGCNGDGWSLSRNDECKSCESISRNYEKYGHSKVLIGAGPSILANDGRGISINPSRAS
jgi:hypothetical protein